MIQAVATHIELRPNGDGQPQAFIAGTRVRVWDIYAQSEIQGRTANEIVEELPDLTLGQVHAALSYLSDHRDQILREKRDDEPPVPEAADTGAVRLTPENDTLVATARSIAKTRPNWPADFVLNHGHYVSGEPKKS
jgi:uncharacterized protein (DUF433 family)